MRGLSLLVDSLVADAAERRRTPHWLQSGCFGSEVEKFLQGPVVDEFVIPRQDVGFVIS